MISVDKQNVIKEPNRQVLRPTDFTDEELLALENARAPERTKELDSELPP
jgi:hypothetical protein